MSNISLINQSGEEKIYPNVETVVLNTVDPVGTEAFISERLIRTQLQADWDQADPTQPDFIKNKPLGSEDSVILLDCTFIDYWRSNADGSGQWSGEMFVEDTSMTELIEGNSYTYIFDGNEYTSTCVKFNGIMVIGNAGAILTGERDEQPIVLARDVTGGLLSGTPGWVCLLVNPSTDPSEVNGQHAFTLYGELVSKLDKKYVSQDVHWQDIKNVPFGPVTAGSVLFEDYAYYFGTGEADKQIYMMISGLPVSLFDVGINTVIVTVNGQNYIGLRSNSNQFTVSIRGSDTTVAYISVESDGTVLFTTVGDTISQQPYHKIKITSLADAKIKLDEQYLPDSAVVYAKPSESDNGKMLGVQNGTWTLLEQSSSLPDVTTDDIGKFLRVSSEGTWAVEAIPMWSGGSY
jgi:hypothetical protein